MSANSPERQRISVVIPCKNEVENIIACIASARSIADEVLVADSGSTDGTLELAHRDADRVVAREYIDSGDFKNWAIPQAQNEWVFILDADERVTEALAAEIKAALVADSVLRDSSPESSKLAYSVPRRNFFLGHPVDYGDWSRDRVIRLMRRSCRYKLHTDHAEVEVPGNRLGTLRAKLVHFTAWDLDSYLTKMHHYAMQQAELWRDRGKRPTLIHLTLNAPMRFLRSYVLRLGFLDGMLGFFIACMTAYYSFLKQFLFWQLEFGRQLQDLEPNSSYAAERRSEDDDIRAEAA